MRNYASEDHPARLARRRHRCRAGGPEFAAPQRPWSLARARPAAVESHGPLPPPPSGAYCGPARCGVEAVSVVGVAASGLPALRRRRPRAGGRRGCSAGPSPPTPSGAREQIDPGRRGEGRPGACVGGFLCRRAAPPVCLSPARGSVRSSDTTAPAGRACAWPVLPPVIVFVARLSGRPFPSP